MGLPVVIHSLAVAGCSIISLVAVGLIYLQRRRGLLLPFLVGPGRFVTRYLTRRRILPTVHHEPRAAR